VKGSLGGRERESWKGVGKEFGKGGKENSERREGEVRKEGKKKFEKKEEKESLLKVYLKEIRKPKL
jgi:hypothetical protein